jgi:hypothetical protein
MQQRQIAQDEANARGQEETEARKKRNGPKAEIMTIPLGSRCCSCKGRIIKAYHSRRVRVACQPDEDQDWHEREMNFQSLKAP